MALPTVKAVLCLTSKEKRLEELPVALLPIATHMRRMEDWPPQSKKAGLAANKWSCSVLLKQCYSIERAFDLLYQNCISPYEDALRESHLDGWKVYFGFVIHMLCGDRPDMTLSPKMLKLMASFDAEAGIDLYDYQDDEKEEFELSWVSPN